MANRETQVPIEVVQVGNPNVRTTQVPIEVVAAGTPHFRATQVTTEVIVPTTVSLNNIMEFIQPG